jgi:hypothetical protein
MSDDFETVVRLSEKDIEILGGLFTQYFVKCNSEPPVDCSAQSELFRKILDARTAQIIEARAAGKFKDAKPLLDTQEPSHFFGGKPGEPVPAVDPDDVKAVWKIQKDPTYPTGAAAGIALFSQVCKPGADLHAVFYRSSFLWLITQMAPEQLERFTEEAMSRAAAKVPAEWMGVGIVRDGPPFDVNEFLALCGK